MRNRVLHRAFERLERYDGKPCRTVLRGLEGSNAFRLPDFHRTQDEECLQVYRPSTVEEVGQVTHDFKWHYNHERSHQAVSCGNQPPCVAFPSLPKLPSLPDRVDPDGWLLVVHRKLFKRRVKANGSIRVDKHDYYISRTLRGRLVVFQVDGVSRELVVEVDGQPLRRVPIKELQNSPMPFQDYLQLMCQEALAEQRRAQRAYSRQRRVAM